jgi:hypothetical protein
MATGLGEIVAEPEGCARGDEAELLHAATTSTTAKTVALIFS